MLLSRLKFRSNFINRLRYYSSQKNNSSLIALKAVESANNALPTWRNTSPIVKRDIFFRAAELLTERKDQIIKATNEEVGIPEFFAGLFVEDTIGFMTALGSLIPSVSKDVIISSPVKGRIPIILKEPIGPVFGIVPWNAPSILAIRAAACPLAAGCSVIIKTSENSPVTQRLTLQALIDAGLPDGALNILEIPPEDSHGVVEQIISHPVIRKVNFTGSPRVGSIVAQLAGKHLKPILLELGGKGAVIIDDTADLKEAAINVVIGAWANSGQICMSTERVFVTKSVAERFLQVLKETAQLEAGKDYLQCQQIHSANAIRIQQLVDQAVDKGARILFSSSNSTADARDVTKYLLTNVSPDMQIYDDETFGPIAYINIVDSLEDAINEVNKSKFGLTTSVWTRSVSHGISIAKKLESGAVHINGNTVFDDGTVPHGGVKNSGFGRFGGQWGIDEFTVLKSITYPAE